MLNAIYARRYLLLLFGIACTSFAPFCIRESTLSPPALLAYRSLIAALALAPLFFYHLRKNPEFEMREIFSTKRALIAVFFPAFFLFAELIFWHSGARITPLVNASMLINLTPLAMPFLLWLIYRAKTTPREKIATAVAMIGLMFLFYTDLNLDSTYFYGDLLCFIGMVFFAVYLCLGRAFAGLPSVFLYIVPLYVVSGVLGLIASFVHAAYSGGYVVEQYIPQDTYQWGVVLALALVPTLIGHTILNKSMQSLRAQAVAVVNVLHPVFAGFIGYIFYDEIPNMNFFIAAVLVFSGIWLVVTARDKVDLPIDDNKKDIADMDDKALSKV